MPKCFIMMPITTPTEYYDKYHNDHNHFQHVMEHLFFPAIKEAGFEPIPPISEGEDIIHAQIIRNLEMCEMALCDLSILNPNVFYEFGIRTALDKAVCIAKDQFTTKVPFDTSIMNNHTYNASLSPWMLKGEIEILSNHIKQSSERSSGKNSMWKYFGFNARGELRPSDSSLEGKLDYMLSWMNTVGLKNQNGDIITSETAPDEKVSIFIDKVDSLLAQIAVIATYRILSRRVHGKNLIEVDTSKYGVGMSYIIEIQQYAKSLDLMIKINSMISHG